MLIIKTNDNSYINEPGKGWNLTDKEGILECLSEQGFYYLFDNTWHKLYNDEVIEIVEEN